MQMMEFPEVTPTRLAKILKSVVGACIVLFTCTHRFFSSTYLIEIYIPNLT